VAMEAGDGPGRMNSSTCEAALQGRGVRPRRELLPGNISPLSSGSHGEKKTKKKKKKKKKKRGR